MDGILGAILYRCIWGDWAIKEETLNISYLNSTIYDKNNEIIGTLSGNENRQIISKEEMSPYLFDAFISIEDERFEKHDGVDWKRTLGAILTFATHRGESSYGGSTITQQVVKNLTGEDDKSKIQGALRKIKEIVRAYQVEDILSKDQILELYLNLIPLGGQMYGVETASMHYFNKPAKDLTLVESAYLAGITNAPSTYNPFGEKDRSDNIKRRVKTVLGKMKELGKIDEDQYKSAVEEVDKGITFTKGKANQNNSLPYHTEEAVKQIVVDLMEKNNWSKEEAELHLYAGGYQIYTTYDPKIQEAVEEQYITKSKNWTSNYKTVTRKKDDGTSVKEEVRVESAIVIIDHKTGQVVAGTDGFGEKKQAWGKSRMTEHIHNPGSSIKPIAVIGPSLEEKLITAGTVVDDVPVKYGSWAPGNSGGGYNGLMNIRWIIRVSRNIPEVKMLEKLTVNKSLEYLEKFGLDITNERNDGLALALGGMSYGPTVLQMAAAYATIANDGTYIEPTFYTKVENSEGILIEKQQETRRVLSEQNAYILKTILKESTGTGLTGTAGATSTRARVSNQDTAGKTGTTNENKALWFCGFTPYYTAAVWRGYDIETDGTPYGGSSTSAALWGAIMNKVHAKLPAAKFIQPSGITTAVICSKSGLLATDECKNDPNGNAAYTEYFVTGTKPTAYCDCHVKAEVCKVSGKLPSEQCKEVEERIFITRKNSDKSDAWKSAADADQMLPTEVCEECKGITEDPTVTPTGTGTPTPSGTPTGGITGTPTPTGTGTVTPAPTGTATNKPTENPTKEPTNTPTKEVTKTEPTPTTTPTE